MTWFFVNKDGDLDLHREQQLVRAWVNLPRRLSGESAHNPAVLNGTKMRKAATASFDVGAYREIEVRQLPQRVGDTCRLGGWKN